MIKAIAFDAFGTICDVAKRKKSFISLFERLGEQNVNDVINDTLRGVQRLQEDALFQVELEEELTSFFEYSDVDAVFTRLRRKGY